MAYVGSEYGHDLFVSYSHGSSDRPGERAYLRPWSLEFVAELTKELCFDRRFRSSLSVFIDQEPRAGGGVDFMSRLGPQLHDSVGRAAVLLILMSQDYLDSEWCKREREWWWAQQRRHSHLDDDRIAIVKIAPTDHEQWPPELKDRPGYPFHDLTDRPLGWIEFPPGPFGREFRKALVDLAGRLASKLDSIRTKNEERRRAREESERLAMTAGQSIYLYSRGEHRDAWVRAAAALTADGYAVVGEPDDPRDDPQQLQRARRRRVDMLADCDALLLVATDDKHAVDEDLVVVGKSDRRLACARRSRTLPCALLDLAGTIGTDVRKASARNLLIDWLDATRTPWTEKVRAWLLGKSGLVETAP